ncbi:calcium-binding protein [Microvirga terricola]|uniref:Calcium-binding protein n=1 Tax=Microvirga terricola TaxID=2719797 RepID=A0ABX0VHJ4_9HYPH|nr:calcium-binding protein [Microvirga terricola]NIX78121.1 calcium-binding protein [Microvirga terricola]
MTILTPWNSPFAVNADSAGDQQDSVLQALSDGTFVAVWSSDQAIFMRFFGADGTPKGTDVKVERKTGDGGKYFPSVTALNNGNFVLAWEDSSDPDTDPDQGLRGQVFTSNGTKVGADFHINSNVTDAQMEISIAGLANGGFAVVYTDVFGDGDGSCVRTRVFSNEGVRLGTDEDPIANSTSANGQVAPATIALKDGRYAIFFHDYSLSDDDKNQTIRGRLFKAGGTPVDLDFLVPSSEGNKSAPAAATLSDGRFVVAWTADIGDDSGNCVKAQLFNADGSKIGGEFLVNERATSGLQSDAVVAALPDGGFAIGYLSRDATEEARVAVFSRDGSLIDDGSVGPAPGSVMTSFSGMTVLADGRLVTSWSDWLEETEDVDVHAQMFDLRQGPVSLGGTSANDEYVGTRFNDYLGGAGGNDHLWGGEGHDVLSGGIGVDTMEGGAGNDTYYVDDSNDVIVETVYGGTDTVFTSVSHALRAFVENLTATGSSSISLTGNELANAIMGNTGKNKISGGAGNDTVNGGLANDTLTGGSGRDTFVFDTKPNAKTNLDRVVDFSVKDDTIWLDNKYMPKIGKGTPAKPVRLDKKMFWIGSAAHDADDRIIYDKAKGILYYDPDGSGRASQVAIATLTKNLKLTVADFYVI